MYNKNHPKNDNTKNLYLKYKQKLLFFKKYKQKPFF